MLKTCAIIFGIIMVIVGILGFIPQATPQGFLLGIFHVNVEHNWIHILTGVISILCGLSSEHASRLFFRAFGVVYLLVAILGIFYGEHHIFGLIANNTADVILHFIIAGLALFLGFGCCCCCKPVDNSVERRREEDSNNTPPRDQRP